MPLANIFFLLCSSAYHHAAASFPWLFLALLFPRFPLCLKLLRPFSPLAFSILFFLLALALPLQLGPALCLGCCADLLLSPLVGAVSGGVHA